MRKIFVLAGVLSVLLLAGCSNSPEGEIKKLEQAKQGAAEKSGYNDCVKKVEDEQKIIEKTMYDCEQNKLKESGYEDGVNCIECGGATNTDGTYPEGYEKCVVCDSTARYNAEVNAYNKCQEENPSKADRLTTFDCLKLLENN